MPDTIPLAGKRPGQFPGAVSALTALAAGKTTARDLLEGCLEAIDQDNAIVNAVVHLDLDQARARLQACR